MSFVDIVQINAKAGNGGNGKLSFRHEKFIAKGGPDGGDGGNGGSVVLKASRNQNTLTAFRYQKEIRAESGEAGGNKKKHGKSSMNLNVLVPIGTMVTDTSGKLVADLVFDDQEAVVAKGGKGGFGNAHFISSKRQAPNFAEKGEKGEECNLTLELKMIADIGLVGLPNAGKSTLLATVSNARPEIANYPFTTLTPSLGVVDIDKKSSVLMADIPGLIEGAASGKGLGHDFLRHIERTAVILHLIDAYNEDVTRAYITVRRELEAYSPELVNRPEIIAISKIDGLDQEIVDDLIKQLKKVAPNTLVLAVSSQSGERLKDLLYELKKAVQNFRNQPKLKKAKPGLPVLTIEDKSEAWQIEEKNGRFIITGPSIERFSSRTDFNNDEAVQRLRDIMRRQGIMHELKRKGIEPNQIIQIGSNMDDSLEY